MVNYLKPGFDLGLFVGVQNINKVKQGNGNENVNIPFREVTYQLRRLLRC